MAEFEDQVVRLEKALQSLERALNPPLWKRFLFGIATGFGTVVGATVVVAIVLWIVQPLTHVSGLGPAIERLTDALNRNGR